MSNKFLENNEMHQKCHTHTHTQTRQNNKTTNLKQQETCNFIQLKSHSKFQLSKKKKILTNNEEVKPEIRSENQVCTFCQKQCL